ncbi:MAG: hypothetical protein KJZ84_21885 [Bryobacteraceae bacterium]|nr:hypothetical protein [Bryobacteraceae bacterium]MCL4797232.1 hypothetical protein [Bryobacteraceae bacterium]
METIFNTFVFVAFVLYVLVLHRLVRFYLTEYPLSLCFILLLLFSGVVQVMFRYNVIHSFWDYTYTEFYWASDLVKYALVSTLVIALILRALAGSGRYRWVRRWLIAGTVLTLLALVLIHQDDRLTRWMTNVMRNFSFVMMLMNLLLWTLLVKKRTSDRTLLLVTAGLGLQMAGEAMGHSLRLMNQATLLLGNLISVLSHLCFLWVWYLAFQPARQNLKRPGATA